MATEVDICNVALARLGDEATLTSIDPPEGSAQADHCARFYPICKDKILREYPWSFAVKRKTPAELLTEPLGGDEHAFMLPTDCLNLLSVHIPGESRSRCGLTEYTVENFQNARAIICSEPSIWLRYVSDEVPSQAFPTDFCDALSWLLASYLAGPMIAGSSGATMAANYMKLYEEALGKAMQADARNNNRRSHVRTVFMPDTDQDGGVYGFN